MISYFEKQKIEDYICYIFSDTGLFNDFIHQTVNSNIPRYATIFYQKCYNMPESISNDHFHYQLLHKQRVEKIFIGKQLFKNQSEIQRSFFDKINEIYKKKIKAQELSFNGEQQDMNQSSKLKEFDITKEMYGQQGNGRLQFL